MLGSTHPLTGDSLSTVGKSLAATLTRIAFLAAFSRRCFSGSLVAGRRLSPCPLFIASHGLSLVESRSDCQERSPFSPITFVPDDEGKYIHPTPKSLVNQSNQKSLVHHHP
jgi:hypothetical protein